MKIRNLVIAGIGCLLLQACAANNATMESTTDCSTTGVSYYTVQEGENLMSIADREYGSRTQWQRIYEANKTTINDPALIYPGQKIVLPE